MEQRKTILGKFFAAVGKLFKDNWKEYALKQAKKIAEDLKDELLPVIGIVNKIKEMVDSPLIDIIVAVIPGDWDDKLRSEVSELLAVVLQKYNDFTDPGDLHTIATKLTEKVSGMSFGQSAATIQFLYEENPDHQLAA